MHFFRVDTDEKRSRSKRAAPEPESNVDATRNGRKFCDNGGGV